MGDDRPDHDPYRCLHRRRRPPAAELGGGGEVDARLSPHGGARERHKIDGDLSDAAAAVTAMNERIAKIESRMTDTQDVMIALSEKLDRFDDQDRKGDAK